jgi:hypothetical protein
LAIIYSKGKIAIVNISIAIIDGPDSPAMQSATIALVGFVAKFPVTISNAV